MLALMAAARRSPRKSSRLGILDVLIDLSGGGNITSMRKHLPKLAGAGKVQSHWWVSCRIEPQSRDPQIVGLYLNAPIDIWNPEVLEEGRSHNRAPDCAFSDMAISARHFNVGLKQSGPCMIPEQVGIADIGLQHVHGHRCRS
jgi:hypothetical protein